MKEINVIINLRDVYNLGGLNSMMNYVIFSDKGTKYSLEFFISPLADIEKMFCVLRTWLEVRNDIVVNLEVSDKTPIWYRSL